jgi:hypothetical protein
MHNDREPDIQLAGLQVWVQGYEFPDSTEYWDANWLIVRILCTAHNAAVKLHGAYVCTFELAAWLDACRALAAGEADHAVLDTIEPNFRLRIEHAGERRGLVATVKITPNNITQFHTMRFDIDPAALRVIVESLKQILQRFPVRCKEQP